MTEKQKLAEALEALKKPLRHYTVGGTAKENQERLVWNRAIDACIKAINGKL